MIIDKKVFKKLNDPKFRRNNFFCGYWIALDQEITCRMGLTNIQYRFFIEVENYDNRT